MTIDDTGSKKCVTVSAPGKVLLAGGYLVLESPNVGLVIAANKRFYCTIQEAEYSGDFQSQVIVRSPQFHSEWEYHIDNDDTAISLQESEKNASRNDFVEKTLRVAFSYIIAIGKEIPKSMIFTIQADNDFYSILPHLEGKSRTPKSVSTLPKFLPCPIDDQGKAQVNKTGLGSSAALVSSMVGAILHFFDLPLDRAHNLAQICHCHAQGKVGSGFDVSAAVHGSQVFQTFSTQTLADFLTQHLPNETALKQSTLESLKDTVESTWEGGCVEKIGLSHGLKMILADVCGGSESPSMARQILAWKASRNTTKEPYWETLASINPRIIQLLKDNDFEGLRVAFQDARISLKQMGEAAGVPVEPDEQTMLADATSAIHRVICCVVPGAGGYDALACLYEGGEATKEKIGDLWANWNHNGTKICPLAVEAESAGGGLRIESSIFNA
jgi:phosphomevalonate kinase